MRGRTRWLKTGAIAAIVAVSLTGCLKRNTDTNISTDTIQTTSVSNLSTLPPSSFDQDLDTHLKDATAAAATWHQDALLTYVSVELPADLAPNTGREVYVFGSAANIDNWYTYSVAEDTGKFVRAIIPKEDYLGRNLDPINFDFWTMNYVQALQLAEANGGADFQTNNSGTTITAYLSERAPKNWLWWTIEYTAPSSETFSLLINPFQGNVVDESGNEVAPAGGQPTPATGTGNTSSGATNTTNTTDTTQQ